MWMQFLDSSTLSDDLVYKFVFQEDESSPLQLVKSLSDLLHSQWVHYHIVNGRWATHTLAQIFLCFASPILYQAISALLFTLLLFLGSHLMVRQNHLLFGSVIICCMLFVLSTGFKTTMLWSLGTFNYLWTTAFTLLFLLYLRLIHNCKRWPIHCLISPLSVFVGSMHEALSLPLSITFLAYITFNYKNVIFQPVILYFLWYIIGMSTCIFSPAMWERLGGDITIFDRIISGAINIFFNVKIGWLLLLTLLFLFKKNKKLFIQKIYQYRYVYLCLMLCIGIIMVCGSNDERVAFFSDFIALLLLIDLWSELISRKWQKYLMIICSVIMFIFYIPAIIVRAENKEITAYIEHQMMESGKELISVRQAHRGNSHILDFFRDRYVNPFVEFSNYCYYTAFNSQDVNVRQAAKLYGKKKLFFLPEDILQKIYNDSNAYTDYGLDLNRQLYVWKLPNHQKIDKVVFHLKPEDISALWPHQRLLAYRDDTFELADHSNYSVVNISNQYYLVFTRPTTNIYRRIDSITYTTICTP